LPRAASVVSAAERLLVTANVRSGWFTCLWLMLALSGLAVLLLLIFPNRNVFSEGYMFEPGTPDAAPFVTPVFELTGRPSNARVSIQTDLKNRWAYFNLALINEQTGQGFEFGREVSYYDNEEDDDPAGRGSDSVIVPSVPAGRYYLRVEPQSSWAVRYSIEVRRGVPNYSFFFLAAGLLLIPPILIRFRARRQGVNRQGVNQ
jgi:hypothetical protein